MSVLLMLTTVTLMLTVGSFTCACNPGYTGDSTSYTGEENVDLP